MTDYQLKTILTMVAMILDGCKNLEEAKEKIKSIVSDNDDKKED